MTLKKTCKFAGKLNCCLKKAAVQFYNYPLAIDLVALPLIIALAIFGVWP